jgi:hypothetical protein
MTIGFPTTSSVLPLNFIWLIIGGLCGVFRIVMVSQHRVRNAIHQPGMLADGGFERVFGRSCHQDGFACEGPFRHCLPSLKI